MVKSSCDAWGNHKVLDCNVTENKSNSFIGNINPFRYKGYYYDKESNMYYCKSRYYNPEWCRWLNADSVAYLDLEYIDGMNLFAYCGNNPVMYVDEEGNFLGIGVGIAIGVAALIAMMAATATKPEISSNITLDTDDSSAFTKKFMLSVTRTMITISNPYIKTIVLDNERMHNWEKTSDEYYVFYQPHQKNKNPSNLPKHEKGEGRRKRDQHGEKGDARRKKNNKNYKIPKNIKNFLLVSNYIIIYF